MSEDGKVSLEERLENDSHYSAKDRTKGFEGVTRRRSGVEQKRELKMPKSSQVEGE
jgi:hypothetical protein